MPGVTPALRARGLEALRELQILEGAQTLVSDTPEESLWTGRPGQPGLAERLAEVLNFTGVTTPLDDPQDEAWVCDLTQRCLEHLPSHLKMRGVQIKQAKLMLGARGLPEIAQAPDLEALRAHMARLARAGGGASQSEDAAMSLLLCALMWRPALQGSDWPGGVTVSAAPLCQLLDLERDHWEDAELTAQWLRAFGLQCALHHGMGPTRASQDPEVARDAWEMVRQSWERPASFGRAFLPALAQQLHGWWWWPQVSAQDAEGALRWGPECIEVAQLYPRPEHLIGVSQRYLDEHRERFGHGLDEARHQALLDEAEALLRAACAHRLHPAMHRLWSQVTDQPRCVERLLVTTPEEARAVGRWAGEMLEPLKTRVRHMEKLMQLCRFEPEGLEALQVGAATQVGRLLATVIAEASRQRARGDHGATPAWAELWDMVLLNHDAPTLSEPLNGVRLIQSTLCCDQGARARQHLGEHLGRHRRSSAKTQAYLHSRWVTGVWQGMLSVYDADNDPAVRTGLLRLMEKMAPHNGSLRSHVDPRMLDTLPELMALISGRLRAEIGGGKVNLSAELSRALMRAAAQHPGRWAGPAWTDQWRAALALEASAAA